MLQKIENFAVTMLRSIAILSLVALFGLILVNIVVRTAGFSGFAWFDEVVRGSFAYMVFFGAAALWLRNDHFRVDWLELLLINRKAAWFLRTVIALLCLGFLITMTYYGWILFSKANAVTPILRIPERLFYLAIPISGGLMTIHTLTRLILETKTTFTKEIVNHDL
jgi:TRAP-type C4-dicarboxylate transport system permease small subunit